MPGIDPISLIPSAFQTIGGTIQSIIGASRERKAENALENLQTPTYTANKSILDYYNQALQRYGVNPYQTAQYNYGIQQGNRNFAAGVNALQDRRSAVGGVSRLMALSNDNALKQGMAAEQEQNQRFGQLGEATNMKSADDRYGFQINKILPYEKQYNLFAAKAAGGAQMLNAGLGNIFGGAGNAGNVLTGKNLYSNTGGNSGSLYTSNTPRLWYKIG